MADQLAEKRLAAAKSLEFIKDGMKIGIGTGSTATLAIEMLGEKVRNGLKVIGVPTSDRSLALAKECGIPMSTLDEIPHLDVTIDGADEVDPDFCLTKGGGGALLREKIVAYNSDKMVVFVDSSKMVRKLGAFPLPVEVIPFAWKPVALELEKLGGAPKVREDGNGNPFRTDENNLILDCHFGAISDPRALAVKLSAIPGVVEHGLFIDIADVVLVAKGEVVDVLERGSK